MQSVKHAWILFLTAPALVLGQPRHDPHHELLYGTWVLDPVSSVFIGRQAPRSQVLSYALHEEGLQATIIFTNADGSIGQDFLHRRSGRRPNGSSGLRKLRRGHHGKSGAVPCHVDFRACRTRDWVCQPYDFPGWNEDDGGSDQIWQFEQPRDLHQAGGRRQRRTLSVKASQPASLATAPLLPSQFLRAAPVGFFRLAGAMRPVALGQLAECIRTEQRGPCYTACQRVETQGEAHEGKTGSACGFGALFRESAFPGGRLYLRLEPR